MNLSKYKNISLSLILINQLFCLNFVKSEEINKINNSIQPTIDYINNIPPESFYILGPGDVLSIRVNNEAKALDHNFAINGEGISYLKRLKKIYTAGLTISELTKILNIEYKKFVKEPDVELLVVKYRPTKIYLDGEVENPGLQTLAGSTKSIDKNIPQDYFITDPFSFDESDQRFTEILADKDSKKVDNDIIYDTTFGYNLAFPTLFDAIRMSGGVTNLADLSNIQITRINKISGGSGRIKTTVNLLDTLILRDSSQNIRLYDGDTIYVPKNSNNVPAQISLAIKSNLNPKYTTVLVTGNVEAPGRKLLGKNSALEDAFDISGGLKSLRGKINFLRYNSDGTIDKRSFSFRKSAPRGSFKNPYLKDGDVIFVGKSKFSIASEVIGEITSPISNIISGYTLYKIFETD